MDDLERTAAMRTNVFTEGHYTLYAVRIQTRPHAGFYDATIAFIHA
jgi:hypothetical protein